MSYKPTEIEKEFKRCYNTSATKKMRTLLDTGEISIEFLNNILETLSFGANHGNMLKIKVIINLEGIDVKHKYHFLLEYLTHGHQRPKRLPNKKDDNYDNIECYLYSGVDYFMEFYNHFLKDESFDPSFSDNFMLKGFLNRINKNITNKEYNREYFDYLEIIEILLNNSKVNEKLSEDDQMYELICTICPECLPNIKEVFIF